MRVVSIGINAVENAKYAVLPISKYGIEALAEFRRKYLPGICGTDCHDGISENDTAAHETDDII